MEGLRERFAVSDFRVRAKNPVRPGVEVIEMKVWSINRKSNLGVQSKHFGAYPRSQTKFLLGTEKAAYAN